MKLKFSLGIINESLGFMESVFLLVGSLEGMLESTSVGKELGSCGNDGAALGHIDGDPDEALGSQAEVEFKSMLGIQEGSNEGISDGN